MRNTKGFTLVEIIVAVALVAILSAAIAPSVLNNIAQGRIARAQSDVQAIAQAVMRFKNDTGKFPRLAKATRPDTAGEEFDFLVSGNGTFPTNASGANWPSALTADATTDGSCEDIQSHLILGISRSASGADSLYTRASNPDDPTLIGYKNPLLSADANDPWGNKYLINVKALGQIGRPVWVLSAGPNGLVETAILANGTGAPSTAAGDDIGFRIQ